MSSGTMSGDPHFVLVTAVGSKRLLVHRQSFLNFRALLWDILVCGEAEGSRSGEFVRDRCGASKLGVFAKTYGTT